LSNLIIFLNLLAMKVAIKLLSGIGKMKTKKPHLRKYKFPMRWKRYFLKMGIQQLLLNKNLKIYKNA